MVLYIVIFRKYCPLEEKRKEKDKNKPTDDETSSIYTVMIITLQFTN